MSLLVLNILLYFTIEKTQGERESVLWYSHFIIYTYTTSLELTSVCAPMKKRLLFKFYVTSIVSYILFRFYTVRSLLYRYLLAYRKNRDTQNKKNLSLLNKMWYAPVISHCFDYTKNFILLLIMEKRDDWCRSAILF